ncbi:MAG: sugar phosphate nucleotidyltransferase [Candidatus Shapirobacteria bacterium]
MSTITKAVIAAGGWSTRFLPSVKTYAKQLVPILDKPQIQWVIEELIGAGITDIAIVHRDGEKSLQNHFTPDPELDKYLEETGKQKCLDSLRFIWSKAKLQFFAQTKAFPYGNGVPIIVAKDFIGHDPFVYLWGDDITIESTPGAFLAGAISLFEKYQPAAVEGIQWIPDSELYRYGTVKFTNNPKIPGQICSLTEKLPAGQAPSNYIQGGRFVVSSKLIETLNHTALAKGELWFADAINYLAQNDLVLTHDYQKNNALWATTGDPKNWLLVNLLLAKSHPDFQDLL